MIVKKIIISLCLYFLVAFFVNAVCETIKFARETNEIALQSHLYNYLKEQSLIPVAISKLPEWVQKNKCVSYYDPNAWDKPDRILFMQPKGRFYCITFGDNRQVITTFYGSIFGRYETEKGLVDLDLKPHVTENWQLIIGMGILATAITLVVVKRKKKVVPVQDSSTPNNNNLP